MTLNVVVLERGGCSAHGGAWFDPRDRIVRLDVFEDEVIDTVIQLPFTPTEFDYEEDGMDASEPVISGDTVTLQFQDLTPSGSYEILIYGASGQKKRVRFQANEAQPIVSAGDIIADDDEDDDPGAWG